MKALLLLLALGAAVEPRPEDEVLPANELTITLGMEAHSHGTEVVLGDIAQVAGTDSELVALVRGTELGYAPAPGYSRVFRTDVIESALRRAHPDVKVRFAGQRAVRVHPTVETVSSEAILAATEVELTRLFAGQEIDFVPTGELQPITIPAGSERHTLRVRLERVPDTSRTVSVPVEVLVDGVRYRTVWTTWDVRVWETRAVLASHVRAGERLRNSMFERRRVLRKPGEGGGLAAGLLEGSVALRDLAVGETVTALDVQRPVVVILGESLFLRVRKGSIQARVAAVALQSGAVGDRIKVQTDSGQELVATIESRDTCTIDLGS